nr:DUF305 domain-containing protein [Brevundimonas alba]
MLILTAAGLALTGCDGEDPVDSALRDAAAARQAAATKTTAEIEAARPAQAAPATSGDTAWIEATIEDHRRTISATALLLERTDDPEVRRAAEKVIAARRREIAELQALRPAATPDE